MGEDGGREREITSAGNHGKNGKPSVGSKEIYRVFERLLRQWQANPASQTHKCDHSTCERHGLNNANTILELRHTVSSLNTRLDGRESKISSLTAKNQSVARTAVLAVRAKDDQLQIKEKALEDEKAGRKKAVEEERTIANERFQSNNSLQAQVDGLKKALTAHRDQCRRANKTNRVKSSEASKAVEAGEAARKEAERMRDELVKAVGQLEGKMTRMVEVDLMEEVEVESGASRKRRNDGEETPRPAKIRRAK